MNNCNFNLIQSLYDAGSSVIFENYLEIRFFKYKINCSLLMIQVNVY